MTKTENKPVVLGLGNFLFRDEGFGIHVVRKLMREKIAKDVELIDGGTRGMMLLNIVEEASNLLVIDAVDGPDEAGTVKVIKDSEIPLLAQQKLSPHQLGFQEVLAIARFRGNFPRQLVLIGVQPKSLDLGTRLTPIVAKKIPQVLDMVHNQVNEWLA